MPARSAPSGATDEQAVLASHDRGDSKVGIASTAGPSAPSRLIDRLRAELGEWNASTPGEATSDHGVGQRSGIGLPFDDDDDAPLSAGTSRDLSSSSSSSESLGSGDESSGVPVGVADDDSVRWPLDSSASPSGVRAPPGAVLDGRHDASGELSSSARNRRDPVGERPPSSPVRTGATREMEALDAVTLAKLDAERRAMHEARRLAQTPAPASTLETGTHDSISISLEDTGGDGFEDEPTPTVTVAGIERPRLQLGGAAALSPAEVARTLEEEKRQLQLEEDEERRKQEARARSAVGARSSAASRKRAEVLHAAVPPSGAKRRSGAGKVAGLALAAAGLVALGLIGAAALGIGGLDKLASGFLEVSPASDSRQASSPGASAGGDDKSSPAAGASPSAGSQAQRTTGGGGALKTSADPGIPGEGSGGPDQAALPAQVANAGDGGVEAGTTSGAQGGEDVVLAGAELRPDGVAAGIAPDNVAAATAGTTGGTTGLGEDVADGAEGTASGGSQGASTPSEPNAAKKPTVIPVTGDDVDELLASARELLAANPAQALALATRAHELEQRNRVLVVLALANCHLGDGPVARSWFRQLQVAELRREATNVCIGLEVEILAKDTGPTPRELVRAGEVELAAGKLDAALSLAKQSLEAKRTMGAQVLAAKVHCSKGDAASAKAVLLRLPSKHRDPIKTHCTAVGQSL